MEFEYNGHLLEEEKNIQVANEIITKYPNIDFDKALKIASLEDKITTKKTPEIELNRLYNILLLTINNNNIHNEVYKDIKKAYNNYLNNNEYKNSKMDDIMTELILFEERKRNKFPLISEFY